MLRPCAAPRCAHAFPHYAPEQSHAAPWAAPRSAPAEPHAALRRCRMLRSSAASYRASCTAPRSAPAQSHAAPLAQPLRPLQLQAAPLCSSTLRPLRSRMLHPCPGPRSAPAQSHTAPLCDSLAHGAPGTQHSPRTSGAPPLPALKLRQVSAPGGAGCRHGPPASTHPGGRE